MVSFVGTNPEGRRVYYRSKTTYALVYAVFAKAPHVPGRRDRWERVALIEDRTYPDEFVRVNGSYLHKNKRDLSPREMADERAKWYREALIGYETFIAELKPSKALAR